VKAKPAETVEGKAEPVFIVVDNYIGAGAANSISETR
jgi:hypothetical protein